MSKTIHVATIVDIDDVEIDKVAAENEADLPKLCAEIIKEWCDDYRDDIGEEYGDMFWSSEEIELHEVKK